jgi:hypothetical protein
LKQKEWKEVKTQNKAPSTRYGHTSVVWKDKMFVYGGYDNSGMICNELDLIKFEWKKLPNPSTSFTNEKAKTLLTLLSRYHHSSAF